MTHAISVDSLAYRAGRHFAIRDLRIRVPNGAVYGFLGPNGSGKTTTIRLLLGMLPPADGSISVLGHDMPRGAQGFHERFFEIEVDDFAERGVA